MVPFEQRSNSCFYNLGRTVLREKYNLKVWSRVTMSADWHDPWIVESRDGDGELLLLSSTSGKGVVVEGSAVSNPYVAVLELFCEDDGAVGGGRG